MVKVDHRLAIAGAAAALLLAAILVVVDRDAPVDVSVPWALIEARGRTLRVLVVEGGCMRFRELSAAESDAAIVVTAIATQPGTSMACTADLRFVPGRLTLDRPLSKRRLEHGGVDAHWQRYQGEVDTFARYRRA